MLTFGHSQSVFDEACVCYSHLLMRILWHNYILVVRVPALEKNHSEN